jgi:hypothetical protein
MSWLMIIFAVVLTAGLVLIGLLALMFIIQNVQRALSGRAQGSPAVGSGGAGPANVDRVCPNDHCRHPNRSGALYCGQCGRRL